MSQFLDPHPRTTRCVMLWDTRPPVKKSLSDTSHKSKAPVDSEKPFSYLDLSWKPLLKVRAALEQVDMITSLYHAYYTCV